MIIESIDSVNVPEMSEAAKQPFLYWIEWIVLNYWIFAVIIVKLRKKLYPGIFFNRLTIQLLASDLLQFEMLKIPAFQAFWKTAFSKSVVILSKTNFNFRFCWMKYSCIYWYCHNSIARDLVKHLNLWKFGNQNLEIWKIWNVKPRNIHKEVIL